MKQRERCVVREQTGRKDCENSRKSKQSTGTWEMEVLRSPLNPEEMDDTELLKDLSGQAAVVRWKRYDAYQYSSGYKRNVHS